MDEYSRKDQFPIPSNRQYKKLSPAVLDAGFIYDADNKLYRATSKHVNIFINFNDSLKGKLALFAGSTFME